MNHLNTLSSKFCSWHPFGKLLTSALLLAGLCGAHTAHAQARFSYSGAGDEVTDSKTGLIWRRCSEGQSWSVGTCSGTAASYTHEQALAQAKTQTGWRLPNVKELASITDKTRSNPAIDVTAFPATPPNFFWTSTPEAWNSNLAWVVDFGDGAVYSHGRSSSNQVRLVR